ncbi:MAG TPA: ATPase [Chloroflexota bacterium]|nr:ATPase [Chloroflexota bacterium]
MDILYLVDRIEAILHSGQKMPFSSKVVVDEHEAMDVLDQMRVVIPEEIKTARRLNQDRERIIQQAEAEGERILKQAEERAEAMIQEHDVFQEVQRRAEEVLARADGQAEEIRSGADQYALEVLRALEAHMKKTIDTVHRGIDTLEDSIRQSAEGSQPPNGA